jgi:hypothetical protein
MNRLGHGLVRPDPGLAGKDAQRESGVSAPKVQRQVAPKIAVPLRKGLSHPTHLIGT